MRIALALVFGLLAIASVAMGVAQAPTAVPPAIPPPPLLASRPWPALPPGAVAVAVAPTVAEARPSQPAPAEPPAAKPAEVAKPVEPAPAPTPAEPEVAKPVEPAPKPAEPAPAPKPVAEPVAAKPEPSAAAIAPKPATPKPAAAPLDAVLHLRASDSADVFVDGKKVGSSPVMGLKVRSGKHRVRFDCVDASGEARPGMPQSVEVPADGELDVPYECPAAE